MKYTLILALLFISLLTSVNTVRGQVRQTGLITPVDPITSVKKKWVPSDHATYVGISAGTLGENYLRAEHSVTEKYMIMQLSAMIGPENYGLQMKMGAGYAPPGSKFRAYIYMPYFNLSLKEMGYNTPFCAEVFFDEKRWQISTNFDIYTIGVVVVPSIRVKYRIAKFKL